MAIIMHKTRRPSTKTFRQNPGNMQCTTSTRSHKPYITTRWFSTKKTPKKWRNYLSTYHLIRKVIYLVKNSPNWLTHPMIEELKDHTQVVIPPPPNQKHNQQEWITRLAQIAKTANTNAQKITTKYT